ncbi:MAG: type II CAAX prenyl endopeptidase Rce1 family protein [Bacteroidota bacterium]
MNPEQLPPEPQLPVQDQKQLPILQRLDPIPFAILALGVVFVLYQLVGGGITLLLFKGQITEENVQVVRWATLIGQIVFILLPTIVLVRLRYPGQHGFFRIKVPDYREVILTVIGVFALQQVLQGYLIVQDAIPLPQRLEELIDTFKGILEQMYRLLITAHSIEEFIFVVIVVALTPAICEELFFRGLIQRTFEEQAKPFKAAIITGIIFAAYHVNPFSFVALVALGAYFGFIVYRSRNLTVAISAHFFNNFIACAALYMQLDDDFVAVAPMAQPTPVLLIANFLVFGLVFLAATYYFVRVTVPTTEVDGRGG